MSIFRGFRRSAQGDPRHDETGGESLFLGRTGMSVASEEYKHLRTAAPADRLLPRTLKWAGDLPADVQPTALLRHYARVANVLAATWEHPTAFGSYMHCLFSDNRGNRQGFPPEVHNELVALKRYYHSVQAEESTG